MVGSLRLSEALLRLALLTMILLCLATPPAPTEGQIVFPLQVLEIQAQVNQFTNTSQVAMTLTLHENSPNPVPASIVSANCLDCGASAQRALFDFVSWTGGNGSWTSVLETMVFMTSDTGQFPKENVTWTIYVGTNLTYYRTSVISSLNTFYVTQTPVEYRNYTFGYTSSYAGVLGEKYANVTEVTFVASHSQSFQTVVTVSSWIPWIIIALAFLLVAVTVLGRRGILDVKDTVGVLATLMLFVPVFVFALAQFVPTQGVPWVEEWLFQMTSFTFFAFIVVAGGVVVATVLGPLVPKAKGTT